MSCLKINGVISLLVIIIQLMFTFADFDPSVSQSVPFGGPNQCYLGALPTEPTGL